MSDELEARGEKLCKLTKTAELVERKLAHARLLYVEQKHKENAEEDAECVKNLFGKTKKGKKTEQPAVSESKVPVKKQKQQQQQKEEPFECAGNVETGEACPGNAEENNVRASDTKFDGKTYASCKGCKKAIKSTRRKKEKK